MSYCSRPIVVSWTLTQEPKTQQGPTDRSDAGTTAPGTPQGQQGGGNLGQGTPPQACGTETLWMMGLFLLLMWLLILRPESRRRKETAAMLSALKHGDTVVTIGGMYGVVDSIQEKTVVLAVDDQRMTFDRTAIARVVRDESSAQKP